jgi:hypothetical protein
MLNEAHGTRPEVNNDIPLLSEFSFFFFFIRSLSFHHLLPDHQEGR